MLIFDLTEMGNKLLLIRKKAGLTQAEVAELAGLSDRTYADIERGTANMRIQTLLLICKSLNITPNDILVTRASNNEISAEEITAKLDTFSDENKRKALRILNILFE